MACIDVAPPTPEAAEEVTAALRELHESAPVTAFNTHLAAKVLRFESVSNEGAFAELLTQLNMPYEIH